jgi:hypothetical protein
VAVTFQGTLQAGSGGGAAVELPPEVVAALGAASKRPRVRATVNGLDYATRLAVYGGKTFVGVYKAVRAELGIAPGDDVSVTLEIETSDA